MPGLEKAPSTLLFVIIFMPASTKTLPPWLFFSNWMPAVSPCEETSQPALFISKLIPAGGETLPSLLFISDSMPASLETVTRPKLQNVKSQGRVGIWGLLEE